MKPGDQWWIIRNQEHPDYTVPYKMPTWYHDYTMQITLDKVSKYIFLIGTPKLILNGEKIDFKQLAEMIGLNPTTVRHHISKGATRYKETLKWDFDLDAFYEEIKDFEAKKLERRERVLLSREERSRISRENLRKAREIRKSQFVARPRVELPPKKTRFDTIKDEGVFLQREKPFISFKDQSIFVNGVQSSLIETCGRLKVSTKTLHSLLLLGDFEFNGSRITLRDRVFIQRVKPTPEETSARLKAMWDKRGRSSPEHFKAMERKRKLRAAAKKLGITEDELIAIRYERANRPKKVYVPKKQKVKSSLVIVSTLDILEDFSSYTHSLTLNGVRTPLADIAKAIGCSNNEVREKTHGGKGFVTDKGQVVHFMKGRVEQDPNRTPILTRLGNKWTVMFNENNRRAYWVSTVDKERAEKVYSDLMTRDWRKEFIEKTS